METRQLGRAGPNVSAIGLGCMGMSGVYGPADRPTAIATIHEALDAGITLLDTGDFYGMGHNELLIAEALGARHRDQVLLSVKFGAQRGPDGAWLGYDARPAAVKTAVAYSLQRLGTDHIDVYRPARLDPRVPIEETVGAIAELIEAGYVRAVGLSEVGVDTIRRANATHPIVDLQIEYSLMSRDIEDTILPTCRDLGIAVTAYGILSRGLLGGHLTRDSAPADLGPFRQHSPRFSAENRDRNLGLVEDLRVVAERRGTTPAQLAIAWVLQQGNDIVPLIGARRPDHLTDALTALDLDLGPDELAAVMAAVPRGATAGHRYPEPQMSQLDSER
jgi:aryl-alcohol dehydrogenase-like predicted oxidoreductase